MLSLLTRSFNYVNRKRAESTWIDLINGHSQKL